MASATPFRALLHLAVGLAVVLGAAQVPSAQDAFSLQTGIEGRVDYVAASGTFRTDDNATDPCAVGTSASGTLSGIPAGATIREARLYWAGSSDVVDGTVTLDGTAVSAEETVTDQFDITLSGSPRSFPFFGGNADVTAAVAAKGNGTYTLTDLAFESVDDPVDTEQTFCTNEVVLGAWSLFVIYEEATLPLRRLNLYDGFLLARNSTVSATIDQFETPAANRSAVTVLTWEGDVRTTADTGEQALFSAGGAAAVTLDGTEPFNSLDRAADGSESTGTYSVDLDRYDVSGQIPTGTTTATFTADAGNDLILVNAIALAMESLSSDLVVDLTATDMQPAAGGRTTLFVDVENLGPDATDGVEVVVPIPAGFTFDASRLPAGASYDAGTGILSVPGPLAVGEGFIAQIDLISDAGAPLSGTASATALDRVETNLANNDDAISAAPAACYAVADNGGANGGNDWLIRVDRSGAPQTTIGTGTGTNAIEAIAYWPGTDTLYGANAGNLGTLAYAGDGAYTRVGTVGFGTASGASADVNITDVDGLAFDPFTGILYGSHRREGNPNLEDLLVQIDPATGTHVPDAFGPGVDYVVIATAAAPTSKNDIDDIAIDALTGQMYGIANSGGTADRLVQIDKATGAVTDVGPIGLGDVEGLTFDALGNLFASTGNTSTTGNSNALVEVDLLTGAGTRLGGFQSGSDHEAVACLTDGVNTLAGSVFFDADANGTDGTGADAPEPGATVTLFRDTDGDGVGDIAVATTTTDANGDYAFEIAAEGDFVVAVADPSGGAGSFTTASDNAVSVDGFGNAAAVPDVGYTTVVDLELTMTVDDPAPEPGETVTFTVTLTNEGLVDATGITVLNALEDIPGVVTVTGVTPSVGTFDGGLWTVGSLAAGAAPVTLTITAVISQDNTAITNLAEIASVDQTDVDSVPLNGSTTEDDDAAATASTSGSSSGGEGGLESNGSLALALAQVQLDRRLDGDAAAPLRPYAPAQTLARRLGAGTFKGSSATLATLVPMDGPAGSSPVEVSPEDLLPVTNALDVVAVDYLDDAGRRLAALFATTTAPGEIYEHTKPVCDRLRGATLERIETLRVAGQPFVMSELHHGGAVDYAVTFVAYPQASGGWAVDSRFLLRDYQPQSAGDAVNVQVWSPSPEWTGALVQDALARLGGEVTFLNTDADAPVLPRTYVRSARYRAGQLEVDLANGAGATALRLTGGSVAATEGAERYTLEQTVALPEGATATVAVPTGPLFDAAFFVETDADGADLLYVADGAWAWAQGEAAVRTFDIRPEPGTFAEATRPVERPVTLAGDVTTWAGLVRPLRPGYQTEDLSAFAGFAFTAEGEGTARVLVETAGIQSSDHWATTVQLRPDATEHRVSFQDLTRDADEPGTFDPSEVVALSFYVYGDGQTAQPFEIGLSGLRFETPAAAVPEATALLPVRPNPFRGRAVVPFELAEAGPVRLEVFDLLGRRVAVLADGEREAGPHRVAFEAAGLSAGVYVARLNAGGESYTRRLTVVR